MDVQYQRRTLQTKALVSVNLLAAILHDPIVAIVAVCTRPQTLTLDMIATRKSIHGFPSLSYTGMGLHLAALWAVRAPLL